MERIIEVKLKVNRHSWFAHMFTVTDSNYEPGYPAGDGKTIQEAIENYLDAAHDFYIGRWNYDDLTYRWS